MTSPAAALAFSERFCLQHPPPPLPADDGSDDPDTHATTPPSLAPDSRMGPPVWRDVSFSFDGSLFAALSQRHAVTVGRTDGDGAAQSRTLQPCVTLGAAPMAVAWAPFPQEPADASLLTTAQRAPIQLWDAADATLRASYRRFDAVDELAAARSLLWAPPGGALWGGYDDGAVCQFDLGCPGRDPVTTQRLRSFGPGAESAAGAKKNMDASAGRDGWRGGQGAVSALAASVPHVTVSASLVAAGCLARPLAELFDSRLRFSVAAVRPDANLDAAVTGRGGGINSSSSGGGGGIVQLAFDPHHPHRLFAARRGRVHGAIAVFDLRDLSAPVALLPRALASHTQRVPFALVSPAAAATGWAAAAAAGGRGGDAAAAGTVVVTGHQPSPTAPPTLRLWATGALPATPGPTIVEPACELVLPVPAASRSAPAAGLAVHPRGTQLLVACGLRSYAPVPRDNDRPPELVAAGWRPAAAAAADIDDDDGASAPAPPPRGAGKRLRPLVGSSDDDGGAPDASVARAPVLVLLGVGERSK